MKCGKTIPVWVEAVRWVEAVKRSEQAMDELVSLFASRDEMAEGYAACLTTYPADWDRWSDFNGAILRRWSPAGLRYIKDKGWKIAHGETAGAGL